MSDIFIKRPILAIVISLMISLVGILAIVNLPIARYPQITPPQVQVRTMYIGAGADTVAKTVASVIEEQVMGVQKMDYMVSTSGNDGSYKLQVVFNQDSDGDMDAVNVQNRVARAMAKLPREVQAIGVTTAKSAGGMDLVFALVSPNGTYDATFLKNYGSNYMLGAIKTIDGVGDVTEFGSDFAMRIWLNPQKMAMHKLTVQDVMNALRSQNIQAPTGSVGATPAPSDQQFQYSINVNGRISDPDKFGDVIIKVDKQGNLLRLKDIARVELNAENYNFLGTIANKDAATFSVSLTSDANALTTIDNIKQALEEQSKSFPEDMKYEVIVDDTKFVKASLNEVMHTFFEALVLVAVIVYLFLQSWRTTLIPMIAVPVSLLGTFASFIPLGFTINTLTLFAMILAIGLVVDDAIVVIEAVEYEMQENHLLPVEATQEAMKKVQNPVIGVALVLASVFIPVAFMGGITGVLYKQFALTIAISVLISAFVALTLTPALCAKMLRPHVPVEDRKVNAFRRFLDKFNEMIDRFTEWYGNLLTKLSKAMIIVIVSLVAFSGVAGYIFKVMPSTFVPQEDAGYFMVAINLPSGATMSRTNKVLEQLNGYFEDVNNVDLTLGVSGFDIISGAAKPNSGIMFARLKPWEERKGMQNSVWAQLLQTFSYGNKSVPSATVIPVNPPPIPGLGSTSGVTMFLVNKQGDTTEEMLEISNAFLKEINSSKKFSNVYTIFNNDTPAYEYEINRDKVAQDGVAYSDVLTALQGLYGSIQVNDFNKYGKNYKVVIQAEEAYRMNIDSNRYINVRNGRGEMIPVSNYITPKEAGVASTLTRFNNYPAVKYSITAGKGVSSGEAIAELKTIAESLPKGYSIDWGDQAREEVKSGSATGFILALGFVFVFLILAALYESWKVPFSVLLSVPSGLIGAAVAPYALGLQNSVYVQIGLLTLVGLAAKNAILIVEYAKVRVDEEGMDETHAAIEAAKIRLRPIVMTSLAFILGCVPLALSSGAGAISRISMGITVVAGMTSATVFGIFVIPMLFILVEKFRIPGFGKSTKE